MHDDYEPETRAETVMVMSHSLLSDLFRSAGPSIKTGEIEAIFAAIKAGVETLVPLDEDVEGAIEKPSAAQIKKSVTPDGITSFLDGKVYKSLKRHLTTHGLTPQEYRQKYGLPFDYPMVAATYAAQRSEMAKASGLGQARTKTAARRVA